MNARSFCPQSGHSRFDIRTLSSVRHSDGRFEPEADIRCAAVIDRLCCIDQSHFQPRFELNRFCKGFTSIVASKIALDRVARVPAKHALVYTRYLKAPVDEVWPMISTAEGVSNWWVAPVSALELKQGGAFNHHWNSFVVDFEDRRFIDFKKQIETKAQEIMRFEISPMGEMQTRFTLLDSFEADVVAVDEPQPHGPGTAWAGLAAGWHGAADSLERLFETGLPVQDWKELFSFYKAYLAEQFDFIDLVRRDD